LIEAGVGLRQVVELVVDARDLEGHLAHAADGHAVAAGREEQELLLQLFAVVGQHLGPILQTPFGISFFPQILGTFPTKTLKLKFNLI
jgi:hypothetical protein